MQRWYLRSTRRFCKHGKFVAGSNVDGGTPSSEDADNVRQNSSVVILGGLRPEMPFVFTEPAGFAIGPVP